MHISGLTHAETAAQLEIEVGAVKTRLHDARAALRRQLWSVWKEEAVAREVDGQLVEMRVADVRQPAAPRRGARSGRGTTRLARRPRGRPRSRRR
jgi:hypothetical protein